jgi:hypothetical protein
VRGYIDADAVGDRLPEVRAGGEVVVVAVQGTVDEVE